MPRSTGGGSHSSGSHSSSYHSSGGSHSSGYSSSHSSYSSHSYSSSSRSSYSGFHSSSYASTSRPARRPSERNPGVFVSNRHFAGSKRYVYYRNKQPHYIYSNYETYKHPRHPGRLTFYVILVISMIAAYYQIFTEPVKLETIGSTRIVIQDSINVIDDKASLEQSLQAFQNQTGITPAVTTLTNESWQSHYTSLEAKAFDLYVNSFCDEQHWLIVYSQPENPDAAFVDWHWEGIAGDDTAPILTDTVIDLFGNKLQKYLTIERIGVGEAIASAFDETAAYLAESGGRDPSDIPGAIFIVLCTMVIGYFRSGYRLRRVKRPPEIPADAVPANSTSEEAPTPDSKPTKRSAPVSTPEIVCAYCCGVLPKGAVKCPHCGAARTGKTQK